MPDRLADYFFVATLQVDPNDPEAECVDPIIVDRYPKKDHKNAPFPQDAAVFCFNEGNVVKHRDIKERKPYFFPFCFTKENGAQYYGTVLMFYELLMNEGQQVLNKEGKELYVPRALCVTSSRPIFSVFVVFLREVYRNSVIHNEGIEDDPSIRSRSTSFESGLRKGSIRELFDMGDDADLPLERQIRYFFDVYPYLEPRMHINMIIFNKILEYSIPPKYSIPFADKLTFDCLFNCLSPKNIIKVVSYMLLDQKIVVVSPEIDNLTLCCEALKSLLWPFKCIHTYIPVLPNFLLESIEAPTPIILGMLTKTFELEYIQENIDSCVVVHLDINKVVPPEGSHLPILPKSFQKELKNYFETEIPALPIRVLYCDNVDIHSSKYIVFEVTFGPGKLGFELHVGKAIVTEGEEEKDVLVLKDTEERQGSQAHLFKQNPFVISVNGSDMLGRSLNSVVNKISKASRPLIIRFQIGTCPDSKIRVASKGLYQSVEGDTPLDLSPMEEIHEPISPIASPTLTPTPDSNNSMNNTNNVREVHKYYNRREKTEENRKDKIAEKEKRANFVMGLRGRFVIQMIKMLNNYLAYINGNAVAPEPLFNSSSFLNQCDEDYYDFLDVFLTTMTFNNFIHLAADEEEDHIDIDYFGEITDIYMKQGEESLFEYISPEHWNMVDVNIPPPDDNGLPEDWYKRTCNRLVADRFPIFEDDLYGDKIKRVKVDIPADKSVNITPLVLRRRQIQRNTMTKSFSKMLKKTLF